MTDEKLALEAEYWKYYRDELFNEIEEYMNGAREAFETPKNCTYNKEKPKHFSELLPTPKFFLLQDILTFIDKTAKNENYNFTFSLKYRED